MAGEHLQTFEVLKADVKHGVLFGFGIVSEVRNAETGEFEPYYDQGSEGAPAYAEHIPPSEMLKAGVKYMASQRLIEEEHNGPAIPGRTLFGFPLTQEIAKALGIITQKTGFLIGYQPADADVVKRAERGELKGFSVRGKCKAREVAA